MDGVGALRFPKCDARHPARVIVHGHCPHGGGLAHDKLAVKLQLGHVGRQLGVDLARLFLVEPTKLLPQPCDLLVARLLVPRPVLELARRATVDDAATARALAQRTFTVAAATTHVQWVGRELEHVIALTLNFERFVEDLLPLLSAQLAAARLGRLELLRSDEDGRQVAERRAFEVIEQAERERLALSLDRLGREVEATPRPGLCHSLVCLCRVQVRAPRACLVPCAPLWRRKALKVLSAAAHTWHEPLPLSCHLGTTGELEQRGSEVLGAQHRRPEALRVDPRQRERP
eukprot:scaffold1672_cov75-Phaeocystis_antarctica.AAC.5